MATIDVPTDCTSAATITRFVDDAGSVLSEGPQALRLDLSGVREMNSMLLAAIVYLARRCRDIGTALRLHSAPQQFLDWAATLGVLEQFRVLGFFAADFSDDPESGASPKSAR